MSVQEPARRSQACMTMDVDARTWYNLHRPPNIDALCLVGPGLRSLQDCRVGLDDDVPPGPPRLDGRRRVAQPKADLQHLKLSSQMSAWGTGVG